MIVRKAAEDETTISFADSWVLEVDAAELSSMRTGRQIRHPEIEKESCCVDESA